MYDHKTIHAILDACPVLHVSFNGVASESDDFPFPTILPMIGCTGSYGDTGPQISAANQSLYLHGYVSSRLMKLPSTDQYQERGTPICVAATLIDGLVLALTPNHNSCNYRSTVIFGYANIVTDENEKLYAMERITNNMLSDRWNNSRVPPTKVEMTSTTILRVEIESASAKCRTGGPGEDRKDLKNDELRERVWTGVIPSWVQWGDPISAEGNLVKTVPQYLGEWIKDQNSQSYANAVEAAEAGKT